MKNVASLGALVLLAACAGYTPLPLDRTPPLRPSLADLHHPGVDIYQPLTIGEVALLAVENNPALRAARGRRGIAEAQVIQAGVLPNPALTGNYTPVLAGPGIIAAWSAGLTQDIKALVTLSARRESARARARQVDAELLWQEWQVIGKARLLTIDLIEGERLRRLLLQARDLLADLYASAQKAMAAGNADLSTVSPDLIALDAVRTRIIDLERLQQTRHHNLNALLGLRADVPVRLAATPHLPPINPGAIERALPLLPDRRPDLIALQLGYRSEEARLRAAILGQFPALLVGFSAGRDVSDVRTLGPQVTMDLPIFNRNQGNIAIGRATRKLLRDEFSARLAVADGDVQAALADWALFRHQIGIVRGELAQAARFARDATTAYRAGNLDERSYVDFVVTRLDKQEELVGLEQGLLDLQVGIATLVGTGMPTVALPGQAPAS